MGKNNIRTMTTNPLTPGGVGGLTAVKDSMVIFFKASLSRRKKVNSEHYAVLILVDPPHPQHGGLLPLQRLGFPAGQHARRPPAGADSHGWLGYRNMFISSTSRHSYCNPLQSVTSGGDISGNHGRITNGSHGHGQHSHAVSHTNGHQSHEYQVQCTYMARLNIP